VTLARAKLTVAGIPRAAHAQSAIRDSTYRATAITALH